jgi:hypothetical protein
MGVPLAAALIAVFAGGPLADAGFLYYLVVFYPITLAVETLLALPRFAAGDSHPGQSNKEAC